MSSLRPLTPDEIAALTGQAAPQPGNAPAGLRPVQAPPPVQAPQQGGGGVAETMGFLNRGLVDALGSIPDLLTYPTRELGKALGFDPRAPSTMAGDAMRGLGIAVARPEDTADNLGARMAEGLGLAAGTLLPGAGVVGALSRAGGAARGIAQTVARPFVATPGAALGLEAASGAAMGAGGFAAENLADDQSWISPPVARGLGEIAGAFTPGALAVGTGAAVNAAVRAPGVNKGLELLERLVRPDQTARLRASGALRSRAGDLDAALAGLDAPGLPGMTTAQRTGDPALMALERGIIAQDPKLRVEVGQQEQTAMRAAAEAAREITGAATPEAARTFFDTTVDAATTRLQQQLERASAAADDAVAALGPRTPGTQAERSRVFEESIETARQAADAERRRLWEAVPETASVDTGAVRSAFQRIVDEAGETNADLVPDIVRRVAASKDDLPPAELDRIYSRLGSDIRSLEASRGVNNADLRRAMAIQAREAVLDTINQSPEKAAPFLAARQATREYHDLYTRGPARAVFDTNARGAGADSGGVLQSILGTPREGSQARLDAIDAALRGSPEGSAAVDDYLRQTLLNALVDAQGSLTPAAGARMLRRSAWLEGRPQLRAEFTDAIDAAAARQQGIREVERDLKAVRDTPGARFVDAGGAREITSVLNAPDPAAAAQALMREALADPSGGAAEGVRRSMTDWLMSRAAVETAGRGRVLRGTQLRAALNDPRTGAAASEIYTAEQLARLNAIADDLTRIELSAAQQPAQEILPVDFIDRGIDFLGRYVGLRAAESSNPGGAGALSYASGVTRFTRALVNRINSSGAERLLSDAVMDPELYRALLAGSRSSPAEQLRAATALERGYTGLTGSVLNDFTETSEDDAILRGLGLAP